MKPLLLLCFGLFQTTAFAQTTISGRVLDAKSGDGLPGVTILQLRTTNGTSSIYDGSFTLSVPGTPDSVTLAVSSVGHVTQQQRVAAGSNKLFRLATDEHAVIIPFGPSTPKLKLSLVSGLRYAPFGACVVLNRSVLFWLPLAVTANYQTNFARNHALSVGIRLPSILPFHSISFTESLEFQQLRIPSANTWFNSYTGVVGLGVGYPGMARWPAVLLGAGYAQWRLRAAEAASTGSGYGYTFGLRFDTLPLHLQATGQASRWAQSWQWQGRLTRYFSHKLEAGVAANKLRRYTEFSLLLTRNFY